MSDVFAPATAACEVAADVLASSCAPLRCRTSEACDADGVIGERGTSWMTTVLLRAADGDCGVDLRGDELMECARRSVSGRARMNLECV